MGARSDQNLLAVFMLKAQGGRFAAINPQGKLKKGQKKTQHIVGPENSNRRRAQKEALWKVPCSRGLATMLVVLPSTNHPPSDEM
jgi:hypothetical protein